MFTRQNWERFSMHSRVIFFIKRYMMNYFNGLTYLVKNPIKTLILNAEHSYIFMCTIKKTLTTKIIYYILNVGYHVIIYRITC